MDLFLYRLAVCRNSKKQTCTSRRNEGVLLLSSGNSVLLDVVVDGKDIQSSAVGSDTNDLMPPGPRACTIYSVNDEYY